MKKNVVMHALALGTLVTLGGCGNCCDHHHAPQTKDSETMTKKTHSCACPHDEEEVTQSSAPSQGGTQQETKSGLMYITLKEAPADAPSPKKGQRVTVHYTGWLDNEGIRGNKFDSSVDRGAPFEFIIGVHQVIQGWDEGVMTMKVGEKRLLIIPPQLGYGTRGAGGVIPPNATLQFEVELLGVE